MEVERKYLLSALPPGEFLGRGAAIRQGYVDAADPEIRVRQKDGEQEPGHPGIRLLVRLFPSDAR
jgi:hypothetical protein